MVTVPVLWLTFHGDAPCRGFWDQGFLDRLFDGRLRRTRYRYDSVEARAPTHWPHPDTGAVVVIPGSYNAARTAAINAFLAQLPWAVVFVTSDEETLFPVDELHHPRLIVYVEPQVGRHYDEHVRFLGMQYPPDTHDVLDRFGAEMADRPTDLFFAGQVTHPRRQRCALAVNECAARGLVVESTFTDSFTAGLPRVDYLAGLAAAKLAPAPSGPAIVDTFRLWEALEAGCIPVADARAEGSRHGYWKRVFRDPPFPVIDDWSTLPDVAAGLLAEWPDNVNVIQAWWQRWQRDFVAHVEATIDEFRGETPPPSPLADVVTVLVSTSPIESHPSLDVLDATLDSVQERLPGVEVVVGFDGVRPEQERLTDAYADYVNAALMSFAYERRNVTPLLMPEWVHQANVTRAMLDLVRTPTVLFVEHDCPLVGDIPFGHLLPVVTAGEANVVRLLPTTEVPEPHRYLMLDDTPRIVNGVPLIATAQWSQRPHVASTAFYRLLIRRYFAPESRTMIEDVMHGTVQTAYREGGWGMFRLFVYAPDGDMQRSAHSDGRGSEPKFGMFVEYDGDPPEFAPRRTVDSDEYRQPGVGS